MSDTTPDPNPLVWQSSPHLPSSASAALSEAESRRRGLELTGLEALVRNND